MILYNTVIIRSEFYFKVVKTRYTNSIIIEEAVGKTVELLPIDGIDLIKRFITIRGNSKNFYATRT